MSDTFNMHLLQKRTIWGIALSFSIILGAQAQIFNPSGKTAAPSAEPQQKAAETKSAKPKPAASMLYTDPENRPQPLETPRSTVRSTTPASQNRTTSNNEEATPRTSLISSPDIDPNELKMESDRNNIGSFSLRFVGDEVIIGEAEPMIDLYMKDFKISQSTNGSVSCNMRFFVRSTVKEKLSNISYRLRWPEMETVVSFDDVQPDTATYVAYTLLGKGCYSMDKTPNVVVNRCRIKGYTQKGCASLIRWIK